VQSQCPTVLPTGVERCMLAPGSVELGASGSSGSFNWYDATTGGTFLGSGSTYNTPYLTSTTTYYVSAKKDNTGLNFDGVNEYVNLGNPSKLQITGDMTIEMWIKPDDFSSRQNPYAKAFGGEGTITQETSGTLSFYYGTTGGNAWPYQGFNSGVSLVLDEWVHIAIVRDLTNMQLYWYMNGVLVNQIAANYPTAAAGGNTAYIGNGYVNNYNGQIDEFRIWNTARSQSDINTTKSSCLLGNETGLVAYYQVEDAPGNSLADLTAPVNNGVLINMELSDWVSVDYDFSCVVCESDRTPVVATVNGGIPVELELVPFIDCCNSAILDAGTGFTNYLWNTGETTQTISTTIEGLHWVKVDDGAGCSDGDSTNVKISSGSGHALDFNGTNQSIFVGNKDSLKIVGNLTIEMWLKPDNFSSRKNPYAKAYGGEGTITQETNGTLNFYYGSTGVNSWPYQGFNSATALTAGEWNHIAIVRDIQRMELAWYINGVLTNQEAAIYIPVSGNLPVLVANGYRDEFDGEMDEVRVWNEARTETQIREKMCSKIITEEPNLKLYYRFDEASGNVVTDLSGGENNGVILNAPTWNVSSASIGDNSAFIYTNSWAGQSLSHSVCSGENLTVSNMIGSPEGVHIYSVGSIPNDITGIIGLGVNNRYFGVHKVNDNTATYDAAYGYALNPYVDLANDLNLLLFKRADNADSPWVTTGAVPNGVANTITTIASSTEFILGASISALPVELISFKAVENFGNIDVSWSTITELNNDYFIIEKSQDGIGWREMLQISGAGNSTSPIDYFEIDDNPFYGISYYRLVQVDFDGTRSYGPKVSVDIDSEYISVFPNPLKNEINITNLSNENTVKVFAMDGKLVFKGNASSIITANWVSGLYELVIFNQNNSVRNRFKIVKV